MALEASDLAKGSVGQTYAAGRRSGHLVVARGRSAAGPMIWRRSKDMLDDRSGKETGCHFQPSTRALVLVKLGRRDLARPGPGIPSNFYTNTRHHHLGVVVVLR